MSRPTMTPEEVEQLSNELRFELQSRACCPEHAGNALMMTLAGFLLDGAGDNRHAAAAQLRRLSKVLAHEIEIGKFAVVRVTQ